MTWSVRMLLNHPGISLSLRFASIAAVLLLANCAHSTPPQVGSKGRIGYLTNTDGELVHSAQGGCVRTGAWEPQYAIKECEPELFARAQAEQAPPQEATASAPAEPQTQATEIAQAPPEQATAREPVRIFVGVDTYFPFNKAELTSDMQRKLDRIAERAKQSEEASIRIVGFADQIGSPDYNFSLSQRRADAVRTYFVEQGIPENALSVDARGETDPVVQCEGRQGASLIDCLQPNRRTEVEFSALEQPQ
jgi:OmpA-OmpF porin, OOP family